MFCGEEPMFLRFLVQLGPYFMWTKVGLCLTTDLIDTLFLQNFFLILPHLVPNIFEVEPKLV